MQIKGNKVENISHGSAIQPMKYLRTVSQPPAVLGVVESVFRCKWSMQILTLINQGICRPGEIRRSLDGLTTKVQNDCLRRLVGFDILERIVYPEVPPRVEYRLTGLGRRFVAILEAIKGLESDINAAV